MRIAIATTLLICSLSGNHITEQSSGFFLNDTQEKVLEAMGSAPDTIENSSSGQTWKYKLSTSSFGYDEIQFINGRVWQYSNTYGTLHLPSFKRSGSTFWLKDGLTEVLRANGAPTRVFRTSTGSSRAVFYYKGNSSYSNSEVEIVDNQVESYNDYSGALSLPMRNPEFPAFGMKASEDEVLKSMGAPTSVSRYSRETNWTYKSSGYRNNVVTFEGSKVAKWQDYDGTLRVSYTSSSKKVSGSTSQVGVDLGDSLSDVLSVMGTPSGVEWVTYKSPPEYKLTWRKGLKESSVTIGTILEGDSYKTDKTIAYDNSNRLLLVALTPNGLKLASNLLESARDNERTYIARPIDSELNGELQRYSVYEKPSGYPSASSAYYSAPSAYSAENGSYYGEISGITGLPKTVYVRNYFRKDGTYVQSHYRSKSR